MTNKEYRQTEGISRSELNILRTQSPFHLKYALENPGEEDTKSLHFGRASHKMILEPDTFFDEFVVAPLCDRRTKEGKEIYSRFLLEAEGKEIIEHDELDMILAMKESIDANPVARALLTGECEQSFFWTDDATGEKLKVRPDCMTEYNGRKYIVDYKTTDSCADGHFERSVNRYGYKFQAGMYREGVFQNTFEDYGFAFVAQEKKAPFAARVFICNDDFLQEGFEQFRQTLDIYHWCKTNDNFYGYEGADSIVTELCGEGEI